MLIYFLMFLLLCRPARAELSDFSSPYPKNEHFLNTTKKQERFQSHIYGSAIIWHAPPITSQITNPDLLKDESIDELAINYLIDGCRQENPEFTKIEKKSKLQNTQIPRISRRLIQAGSQHIDYNLIKWKDSGPAYNQYEHIIHYIKNNFFEYKKLYLVQEIHNSKILESSETAKRNLERLCGQTAVQKVISLYQNP
ncbi:MAG: hypothetical protein RLZZ361_597 [Cyanobacteriota bacterium]